MFHRLTCVPLIFALAVAPAGVLAAQTDAEAGRTFERLVKTHREAEVIDLTCTLRISLSQDELASEGEPVEARFVRLRNGDGLLTLRGYTVYINGDQIYAIHDTNPEEFYRQDVHAFPQNSIVWECFGSFDRVPFPHLGILWGSEKMDELYMEIFIDTPEIEPAAVLDRLVEGRRLRTLELRGPDGRMAIDFDAATFMVDRIVHTVTGGPTVRPGVVKTLTYEISYADDETRLEAAKVRFDAGDRQRVGMMSLLDRSAILAEAEREQRREGEGVAVGRPAPGFMLPTLDGRLVDLTEMPGEVIVLDFWAVWCGFCVEALPHLHEVAAWAEERRLPVRIYAVNTREHGDSLEEKLRIVRRFWTERAFSLPVLMDADSEVAGVYGVEGIPVTIVIGRDGMIAHRHEGFGPNYAQQLREAIEKALRF